MFKKLIAIHNNSHLPITVSGKDGEQPWGSNPLLPGKVMDFRPNPAGSMPIPNNSNSSKYFDEHHISIMFPAGTAVPVGWSFWADDNHDFVLQYCEGKDWQKSTRGTMPGGSKGGDDAEVVIFVHSKKVTPAPPAPDYYEYSIAAVTTSRAEQQKVIATKFRPVTALIGRDTLKGDPHAAAAAVRTVAATKEFGELREQAHTSGFNSLALVSGGGGSFVIGGEYMKGLLMGIASETGYYTLSSVDITVGAEEGLDEFIGLYLATEQPDKVGGLEFFGELAGGLGEGIAVRAFWSLSGGFGWLFALTTGEELAASFGVGHTSVSKLS